MAMNPMQKKARTSFLLGVFVTLIITGIIIALLFMQISKMKKDEAAIQYVDAYVVSEDVSSGDNIDGKIIKQTVRADACPDNAIGASNYADFISESTTAKISLREGTILTNEMIYTDGAEVSSDQRLQEYNMVNLPSQLTEGETVDIRLRLPSGVDYIVLSKKHVEQTSEDTIWIKVREDEILLMSNAIVEAYIMEGAELYATTYVDAGMQDSSSLTYVASQDVINLLNVDPNITAEAKSALAQRYSDETRAQRSAINKDLENYTDDAKTNIEAGVSESIEKQKTARADYVAGL